MSNSQPVTKEEVVGFLKSLDRVAVVCHAHPDGDAIGSGIGLSLLLKKMGKDVIFIAPSRIADRFSFMTKGCPVPIYIYGEDRTAALLDRRTVVTVDTASIQMVEEMESAFTGGYRPALSIDHHRGCTPFSEKLLLDAEASACAEIIAELVIMMHALDKQIALPLYVGINADTGGFRFSNTTFRTHEIAAMLLATGVDAGAVNTALYETRSLAEMTAEKLALETIKLYAKGTVGVVTFTKEMMEANQLRDEDIDNVVNLIRSLDSVSVAIHLKPRGNGIYKVSMRSKNGVVISDVCASLGGGGHIYAAGATVCGATPEEAEKTVLEKVHELLGIVL